MTTQYAEEQGFKKKYLAPLIVLMLCAVSLTGAAYAYSTTVSNTGNIDGDYYSIDMYDKTSEKYITTSIDFGDFDVETAKEVGHNYSAKIVDTDADGYIVLEYILKTKVQSSQKEACKITGTAAYTKQTGTGSFYDSWATEAKCVVSFATAADGTYADDSITGETETMYFVKVTVTLTAINSTDIGTDDPDKISGLLTFVGEGCLKIVLTATESSA